MKLEVIVILSLLLVLSEASGRCKDDFSNNWSADKEPTKLKKKILETKNENLCEHKINHHSRFLYHSLTFDRFYEYLDINNYLTSLAVKYPKRVRVKEEGLSYEKKPILSIEISNGDFNNKNYILIDAGIHGREWIAPAMALYIINELVINFKRNENLLLNYNWIVMPMVNPDGYEYSMRHTKLWRKSRRPNFYDKRTRSSSEFSGQVLNICDKKIYHLGDSFSFEKPVEIEGFGTDLNRNFDFNWNYDKNSSGCRQNYAGAKAFSEPETRILRDVMQNVANRTDMYLTLHSFGSYILYPYAYNDRKPINLDYLQEVANAGVKKIKKYKFQAKSASFLYSVSGTSLDYAYEKLKIPISLTIELPLDKFHPHPIEISPIVENCWLGIKEMANVVQIKNNNYV